MISGNFSSVGRPVAAMAWLFLAAMAALGPSAALCAAEPAAAGRDTLVFKDGDRVQGTLVSDAGGILVFRSGRFGELRVPAADATLVKAPQPAAAAPAAAAVAAAKEKPREHHDEDDHVSIWERFSPAALTARVRGYFGPWHGRFAFGTEVVTDNADRANTSLEAQLKRKWTTDEVQISGRFDYSETNSVTTTDLIKLAGQWRHDFDARLFAHYRPTSEWNRASTLRGVPNDYLLLQQELGAGYQLFAQPSRKVRAGVSENRFDTWNSSAFAPAHTSRGLVSAFEETEFALPWRITVAQRGVWYPVADQPDGWENRIDLNKKLTETLSTSLRHEIRRNNPDGSAQDYTRLKLLFGLDF